MIATETTLTTQQVAARFSELAQREKWFEIQDELFADDVKSIEPPHSPYLPMLKARHSFVKKVKTG